MVSLNDNLQLGECLTDVTASSLLSIGIRTLRLSDLSWRNLLSKVWGGCLFDNLEIQAVEPENHVGERNKAGYMFEETKRGKQNHL